MRSNLVIAGMAALALLAPEAAQACVVIGGGMYGYGADADWRPAAVLRRSATVDWVRFEGRPAYRCRSAANRFAPDKGHPVCRDTAALEAPFVAVVRERLKGHSPARFVLHGDAPSARNESPDTFVDPRGESLEDRLFFAARQKAEADDHHIALIDWHQPLLSMAGVSDHSDCGGTTPAVDARLSYIVFRDPAGAVIATIPVTRGDDEWLQRLRRYANDPDRFARAEVDVRSFLGLVNRAAVGTVTECRVLTPGDYRVSKVSPERGEIGDLSGGVPELQPDTWNFVAEYFAWKRQLCPVGGRILATRIEWSGRIHADLQWARAEVPEMTDAEFQKVLSREAHTRYWAPDRPGVALVRDGKIRTADLMTDLVLTGPPEITVDQVLQWARTDGAPTGQETLEITPSVEMPARAGSIPQAWEYWLPVGWTLGQALSAMAVAVVALLGGGAIALWGARRRGRR